MKDNCTFPTSVKPGIPRLNSEPPSNWVKLTMFDVFEKVERKATIEDETEYSLVTVKRSRKGVEKRGMFKGKEIKVKSQFFIKENDFLISKRQIVHGACGIVPKELQDSIVSNEYLVLKPREGFDLKYLKYYSHSVYFQQTCFHSSIGVHIEKMIFKPKWWFKFQHYFPKYKEQLQIANILDSWQKAINLIEELISYKQELKVGLAEKLLLGKIRIKGFDDTWTKIRLGDYVKLQGGYAFKSKEFLSHGMPIVRISNIKNGAIDLKDAVYYSPEGINESFYVKRGDLLIAMSGATTGKVGVYTEDKNALLNQRVGNLKIVREGIHKSYLTQLVQSKVFKNITNKMMAAGAQPNISSTFFNQLKINIPKQEEQKKIAQLLSNVDKEISILRKKRSFLLIQKKGLIQKLFHQRTELLTI